MSKVAKRAKQSKMKDRVKKTAGERISDIMGCLEVHYGKFTLIRNPCTGHSWPASEFVWLAIRIFEANEDQVELFFDGVLWSDALVFKVEAIPTFMEEAHVRGIDMNRYRPQHYA